MVAEVDPEGELRQRYSGYVSGIARAEAFCQAVAGEVEADSQSLELLICRQSLQNAAILQGLIIPRMN